MSGLKYLLTFCMCFLLLVSANSFAQEWTFLNTSRMGAAGFIQNNPQFDGRDVVVIVLDTGVDMGIAGLQELPDGSVKVIDAQDFSGEGDVDIIKTEAIFSGPEIYLEHPDGLKLYGFESLDHKAVDSVYYIGILDEKRFINSVLNDINNNGKNNDTFGLIVFESDTGWLAYIDLDGDGNLQDEEAIWNYKEKFQALQFRGRDTQDDRNMATFALNIFPDERRVNFHFDGSSHGTHVAGIAAGYKINGQDGLNGIAPGAKIISLKIGDCRLAGGATTTGSMLDAYEYGIEFAKNYNGPVVFNMSFGIGSEIEGLADMDLILDDLLLENENIVVCTSAGNEGPGISTVGLPSSAKHIITVGALNTKESARDVYGAKLNEDKIFVFSSRGGELNKPDVLAPGSASSTVPPFSTRENKWGTSMASPQAAGAVAIVMSAAHQQDPPLKINGPMMKKALKNSAGFLKNYQPVEQGSGVVNIPLAFEYYKKYMQNNKADVLFAYDINTTSPIYQSENGEAAYWRFGSYLPDKDHKQRFYINPVFTDKMDADQKYNFYRAFRLKSSAPWLKLNKSSTYIKGETAAIVDVYFDREQLKKPGLYSAKISAYRKGGLFSGKKPVNKEFELMCNAIVPHEFNATNDYSWKSGTIKIEPGNVERIFFSIPVMASSALISISGGDAEYSKIRGFLYDPKGRETKHFLNYNREKQDKQTIRLTGADLKPGTWELDLYADFRNENISSANITISFSGLETKPAVLKRVRIRNGSNPRGSFKAVNHYTKTIDAKIGGKINGFQKVFDINDSSDKYEYSFNVSDSYEKVVFEIDMPAEHYNKFTDCAVNISDYNGKYLIADGLSYSKKTITFVPPASGDYIFEIIPGFAAQEPKYWQAKITESYYMFKKMPISGSRQTFYPGLEKSVDFSIKGSLPVAPDGFHLFGEIWLNSQDISKYRTILPVRLETGINN